MEFPRGPLTRQEGFNSEKNIPSNSILILFGNVDLFEFPRESLTKQEGLDSKNLFHKNQSHFFVGFKYLLEFPRGPLTKQEGFNSERKYSIKFNFDSFLKYTFIRIPEGIPY